MTSPPKSTLVLLPATRAVLRQVHRATGTPVLVKAQKELKYTDSSTLGVASRYHYFVHHIDFDPCLRSTVDYLVTFQCGKLLRFFASPRDERSYLAPVPQFLDLVRPFAPIDPRSEQALMLRCLARPFHTAAFLRIMRKGIFREVDAFLMDEAAIRLAYRLLGHISDVPVDLRVDAWLADAYPYLTGLQYFYLTDCLHDPPTIRPPIQRESTPELFWPTADALNAAHTLFWSQRFDLPQAMQPYDKAGLRPLAEELLALWHAVPAEPENDGELIDRWSRALGVTAWREWVDFESAPPQPPGRIGLPEWILDKMRSGRWTAELDPSMG